MNNQISKLDFQLKNKIRKSLFPTGIVFVAIVSLGVFALSAAGYVYSYSRYYQPYPQRTFFVSAEGKATAIPDIAQFTFSVITQGGLNTAILQKENTENVNSGIAFLKASGVEQKDITTEYYSIYPRYEYSDCSERDVKCAPPAIVGYTISQTVKVKVRDFEKVGDLLSGIVDKGANSVSELYFIVDDSTTIENQAREQAISKAKEKAQSIAKAGGVRLGKLLSIQEGQGYNDYSGYGMGGSGIESARSVPAIEPGSKEIKITVTLSYEMK